MKRLSGNRQRFIMVLVSAAIVLIALKPTVLYAVDESSCEVCHSKIAVEHRGSIHATVDMSCTTCHGGDPANPDSSAMSATSGFKANPRLETPVFCGTCHTDRKMMAQYGLSVHQLEDYKAGIHGISWSEGNADTAVCTDCHSAHKIKKAEDPDSTISKRNIASTCGRCHADQDLMAKFGLGVAMVEEYAQSVHAQYSEGVYRLKASCISCHSSHATMLPDAVESSNICNQCHSQIKNLIKNGPHSSLFEQGAMSCQSCHGHYGIQKATETGLISYCSDCHSSDTTAAETGVKISKLITDTRRAYKASIETIGVLETQGYFVQELKGRLEEANMGIEEAARDSHLMDLNKVDDDLAITQAVINEVAQAKKTFSSTVSVRKHLLIPLWIYVGLMVILLTRKRMRDEKTSD